MTSQNSRKIKYNLGIIIISELTKRTALNEE